MKERLIFVTNDDGYQAKGFEAALQVAREFGRVVAVAPATMQSGKSQAITMYDPLVLDKQREEEGLEVYSFSGTPVDCVKVAFDHLLVDRKVDLVISGINHGSNAGINVLYSGTMGAAQWPNSVVSFIYPGFLQMPGSAVRHVSFPSM